MERWHCLITHESHKKTEKHLDLKLHKHNFGWEKTSLAAIQPKVVAIFQCSQMGSQPFVFVSLCVCVCDCVYEKRAREGIYSLGHASNCRTKFYHVRVGKKETTQSLSGVSKCRREKRYRLNGSAAHVSH